MIAYGGNRSTCAPRGGKLKLQLQHRFSTTTLSSWKYRLLCCCVTRDVTQSNGLQEGSFIFLFSVSFFDEEVNFFIYFFYFCREIRKEHEWTRSRLALQAQHTCSSAPAETPFPDISLLKDLDSSAMKKKKKQFEPRCQRLN